MQNISPTSHSEVNDVLNLVLKHARAILKEQFVGMYLYGSLSSGDFDPESSDIDFLVVTAEELAPETIAALEAMHRQTWANSHTRAGKLEGAYVPKALIRRHAPGAPPCPTINEGRFYLDSLGSDWDIQRHVVREYGVIVDGPDAKTLIDFVSADDIRNAVKGVLREWWFPMLNNPAWLKENERGYHSYAILSMCRVLHALTHGVIASKPVAARWAQANLHPKWTPIIEQALIARKPTPETFDLLAPAIEFIQFVKDNTVL